MYLITQLQPNAKIFFTLAQRDDKPVQKALSECKADGPARLVCLCRGLPGAPMWSYAHVSGVFHPRRADDTVHLHSTSCRHGSAPDFASAFGAAPGALSERHGQPLIDLGCLFRGRATNARSSGSGGKFVVPSRAPAMLSLAWFLMSQSGLTIWHQGLKFRSPLNELASGARGVQVKTRKATVCLDQMLLLPAQAGARQQVAANYAALRAADKGGHHVIVMALLPRPGDGLGPMGELRLRDSLGVSVTVFPETLDPGLSKFSQAANRWRRGLGPVMIVGLAKPDVRPPSGLNSGRVVAKVEHFALMEVTDDLVPVPCKTKELELTFCRANNDIYVTGPQDDGALRLWSSRHRYSPGLST